MYHRDPFYLPIIYLIFYISDYNFYPAIYVDGYRPSIVFEVAHIISFTNSHIIQFSFHL